MNIDTLIVMPDDGGGPQAIYKDSRESKFYRDNWFSGHGCEGNPEEITQIEYVELAHKAYVEHQKEINRIQDILDKLAAEI